MSSVFTKWATRRSCIEDSADFPTLPSPFTIISILSGCLTLYSYGLNHGGPPVMIWGWVIVGGLVLFAGLSMAEICSAFPTAGGLYYWSAKLGAG